MQDKINQDIKAALLAGEKEKVSTLKMVKTALQMAALDVKGDFTDEAAIKVLQKEAKKRRDAAEMYDKGEAKDLATKERAEAEIIQEYLPKALSDVEVAAIVDEVMSGGADNMGQIIGQVMQKAAGKTDGGTVSRIVKGKLG